METFNPSLVQKLYRSKCNTHSKINFCEQYCVEIVIVYSSSIGKRLQDGERPFAAKFESIMNSCFVKYNAGLKENVNVAQEVNALSKKLFVFSQF